MEHRIEPVKRSRLSDEVLKQLQAMILDGTLEEGEQLPPEKILSEQFQVSSGSIREALRILETLGFLGSGQGSGGGLTVRKVGKESLLNPFAGFLGCERRTILEMLEFRKLLETEIALLAAENRTEEDLAAIGASISLMRKDIIAGGIGIEGDNAFHDSLATAAHNSVFEKMLSLSRGLLVKTRETTLTIPGQPEKSLMDHIDIFNAVKNCNGELAGELMLEHLLKARANSAGVLED